MRHLPVLFVVLGAAAARAQGPDAGSGSGSGSDAGEPTFEPARIEAARAGATTPSEPLVLDELRIGGSDRLEVFMFADASAAAMTNEQPTFFKMGDLGLQITTHLATGLVGRMESMISYNEEFGTSVDLERMYLEYRRAGWAIAAGRTHAELGYWNNAFHHGRWLQLTIARPHVLRFEDDGGILPIHHVGVAVVHGPPRGEQGLEIALGVSNGHGPTMLGIQGLHDDNLAKAVVVRIGLVGLLHDTLRLGGNVAIDRMKAYPAMVYPLLPDQPMTELITGAYLALRGDPLIVFSEVYDVLHQGGGKSWNTVDGFVVAGYRLGQLIPYTQVETRRGDIGSDPFYNPSLMFQPEAVTPGDYVEGLIGLHYDLSAWSAFKLELEAHVPQGQATEYRAELNWSFGR